MIANERALRVRSLVIACQMAWSSLDKGSSLACQIISPFNKKIGSFGKAIFLILFAETTQLIVEWGSYLTSQSDGVKKFPKPLRTADRFCFRYELAMPLFKLVPIHGPRVLTYYGQFLGELLFAYGQFFSVSSLVIFDLAL